MGYRYQPPRESEAVRRVVNLALPLFMRLHERVVRVRLAPGDRDRLRALRESRALFTANHPSETEPVIMVWLARELGEPFSYLATHEIFNGLRGWVVNRMGAFSVRRGWPDGAALRTCRHLLADRDRKLVIFPEGETHMQNDLILPLHSGAVQVGFWALERLERQGKDLSLPIVPVIIRYRYVGEPLPQLLRGVARLEQHLGMSPDPSGLPVDRLYQAGLLVLKGIEREYCLAPADAASVDDRIRNLARCISDRIAHVVRVPPPGPGPVHLRMRALFNAVFDYMDGLSAGTTPYERRLHARRLVATRACLNDLWRIQNFMVISEECLAPPVAPERLGEVLCRLEKEVYGRPRTGPLREAIIHVGEPLQLAHSLPEYRNDRRGTVARCTQELEERLRALLRTSSDGVNPEGPPAAAHTAHPAPDADAISGSSIFPRR